MKKKIGLYIAVVVLVCLCGALCAFAAGCGEENVGVAVTEAGLRLAPNAEGWTVVGGDADASEIAVPDKHEDLPVTAIAANAFRGDAAESLTLGKNVTTIGDYAFADCRSLTSVSLPAGVTEIGAAVFKNCGKLTRAELPVDALGYVEIKNLRSVTLNAGAKLPAYAFADCALLERVSLPDGMTALGADAFRGCASLAYLSLPASLKKVGCGAFYNCGTRAEVRFRGDLTDWCALDFGDAAANPLRCAAKAYIAGELLSALVLPDSVTAVGNYAFCGYGALNFVVVPEGVGSIGASAFYGCSALKSVTLPASVTAIGASAFAATGLTALSLPSGVDYIGASAFANCSELASIAVAADNETYYAADNCLFERASGKLTLGCRNSVIPSNVTEIGAYAFAGCEADTIALPLALEKIGDRAFYKCLKFKRLTVPRGVTTIGKSAFGRCDSLLNLTLENLDGWFRAADAAAQRASGFALDGLADTFVAARFVTTTYADYYWKRGH